jgi:hypothetical protein
MPKDNAKPNTDNVKPWKKKPQATAATSTE